MLKVTRHMIFNFYTSKSYHKQFIIVQIRVVCKFIFKLRLYDFKPILFTCGIFTNNKLYKHKFIIKVLLLNFTTRCYTQIKFKILYHKT